MLHINAYNRNQNLEAFQISAYMRNGKIQNSNELLDNITGVLYLKRVKTLLIPLKHLQFNDGNTGKCWLLLEIQLQTIQNIYAVKTPNVRHTINAEKQYMIIKRNYSSTGKFVEQEQL